MRTPGGMQGAVNAVQWQSTGYSQRGMLFNIQVSSSCWRLCTPIHGDCTPGLPRHRLHCSCTSNKPGGL